MRILLSNDDGIWSPGLEALRVALEPLGEVWVVAPDRERSASGHALTLHSPLRVHPVGERRFAVDGTPADCVYVGLHHLMRGNPPDVVATGINLGANVADDITYSGTVAAAREATMCGRLAVAFSMCGRGPGGQWDFGPAMRFAPRIVSEVLRRRLPPGILLNVNIPPQSDGVRWRATRQGRRGYGNEVHAKSDPRGRDYFWVGGDELEHEDVPGSDANAVYDERIISVMPIQLDVTHEATRQWVEGWDLSSNVSTHPSPHLPAPSGTPPGETGT